MDKVPKTGWATSVPPCFKRKSSACWWPFPIPLPSEPSSQGLGKSHVQFGSWETRFPAPACRRSYPALRLFPPTGMKLWLQSFVLRKRAGAEVPPKTE